MKHDEMTSPFTLSRDQERFGNVGSVAIVGNSPRLARGSFGSRIDAHDVIIRINDGPTKGHEETAGSRTNYRFLGIPIKDRHARFLKGLKEESVIVTRAENRDIFRELGLSNDVVWMEDYLQTARTSFQRLLPLIELEDIPKKNPRSGIVVLSLLADAMAASVSVSLFGFETEPRTDGDAHYFRDNRQFANTLSNWDEFHCPMKYEFLALRKLQEKKFIAIY